MLSSWVPTNFHLNVRAKQIRNINTKNHFFRPTHSTHTHNTTLKIATTKVSSLFVWRHFGKSGKPKKKTTNENFKNVFQRLETKEKREKITRGSGFNHEKWLMKNYRTHLKYSFFADTMVNFQLNTCVCVCVCLRSFFLSSHFRSFHKIT